MNSLERHVIRSMVFEGKLKSKIQRSSFQKNEDKIEETDTDRATKSI